MGANSKIEWTDHTFNPWWGCTKVDPKCANCYADALAKRYGLDVWGPKASRRQMSDNHWKQPIKWNREIWQCDGCGHLYPEAFIDQVRCNATRCEGRTQLIRPRVFCASMADVFEGPETCQNVEAYAMIQRERLRLFEMIRQTPNLDWLLLTKRPQNIKPMLSEMELTCYQSRPDLFPGLAGMLNLWNQSAAPPANVWLGTSNEKDSQVLAAVPAVVHFLSIEPLLADPGIIDLRGIEWSIAGGESGANARPMHPDWARSVRNQCIASGVPFFFKQWGEWAETEPHEEPIRKNGDIYFRSDGRVCGSVAYTLYRTREPFKGTVISCTFRTTEPHDERFGSYCTMRRVGKKKAGRVLDGRTWDEFPEVAR